MLHVGAQGQTLPANETCRSVGTPSTPSTPGRDLALLQMNRSVGRAVQSSTGWSENQIRAELQGIADLDRMYWEVGKYSAADTQHVISSSSHGHLIVDGVKRWEFVAGLAGPFHPALGVGAVLVNSFSEANDAVYNKVMAAVKPYVKRQVYKSDMDDALDKMDEEVRKLVHNINFKEWMDDSKMIYDVQNGLHTAWNKMTNGCYEGVRTQPSDCNDYLRGCQVFEATHLVALRHAVLAHLASIESHYVFLLDEHTKKMQHKLGLLHNAMFECMSSKMPDWGDSAPAEKVYQTATKEMLQLAPISLRAHDHSMRHMEAKLHNVVGCLDGTGMCGCDGCFLQGMWKKNTGRTDIGVKYIESLAVKTAVSGYAREVAADGWHLHCPEGTYITGLRKTSSGSYFKSARCARLKIPNAQNEKRVWEHIPKGCVNGKNINHYTGKSVQECKNICDSNPLCKAFEYGVNYNGGGPYKDGDCQPQEEFEPADCDGGYWNLDLYVKETSGYTMSYGSPCYVYGSSTIRPRWFGCPLNMFMTDFSFYDTPLHFTCCEFPSHINWPTN